MTLKHLSYKKTGYFSELMIDYLAKKEDLLPFFGRFHSIEKRPKKGSKSSFLAK